VIASRSTYRERFQPFGVLFVLDEEMKVTQVSGNVSDHLSLRVDEVLGRPLSESVDPAGAKKCVRCCANSAGTTRTRCVSPRAGSDSTGSFTATMAPRSSSSSQPRRFQSVRSITRSAQRSCACSARAR
jgi:hypothetical protein